MDPVASTYIKIAQQGYKGFYSTQRSIHSVADLSDLPYFIPVKYEGKTYRTFLFIPGRPPVCFACKAQGHMKSSCPNTSKYPAVPASLPPPEPDQKISTEDVVEETADGNHGEDDSEVERDVSYRIEVPKGDKKSYITYESEVLEVTPPEERRERYTDSEKKLRTKCTSKKCFWIPLWAGNRLTFQDMDDHLSNVHEHFQLVEC